MKYIYLLYFVIGLFAAIFGVVGLINGQGNKATFIAIIAIGAYFIGRGAYIVHSQKYR